MAGTLVEAIRWWSVEQSEKLAIVTVDDSVTYGALDVWSNEVAAWLVDNDVIPGDRICIYSANSLEWCVFAQGIMRVGGIVVPINPRFTISEAEYFINRVSPKFVFFDEQREANAKALQKRLEGISIQCLDMVQAFRGRQVSLFESKAISPDFPVVIVATSGSTGFPKGVVLSHRSMMNNYNDFALAYAHAADHPNIMVFPPLCTSAGFYMLHECLVFGGTAFIEDGFDPVRSLKRIEEDRITILMGVPVFFELMANCAEFHDVDMSSIRLAQSGGAPVSQHLMETWRDRDIVIQQMYGQTEAGGNATINSPQDSIEFPEKCGKGMPFTRLGIIDEQGNFCGPGVAGEIVVKGPGIMVGYWDDPEETNKTIVDGWLRTGDLGRLDELGRLTMLDRIKDLIISGGLNISAAEVERVIRDFPGMEEVAVISAKDDKFGETPMAVIYSREDVDVSALIQHCCENLSDYKVIRYVALSTDPLPRLASGKISKMELRKQYADAHLTMEKVR